MIMSDPRGKPDRPKAESQVAGENHSTDQAPDQVDDVDFLVEEFDMNIPEASDLVARDDTEAEALEQAERRRQGSKDPLDQVPTPKEPASDLTADVDEERLTPVIHERNERSGGG
jgi:hypothetical protein